MNNTTQWDDARVFQAIRNGSVEALSELYLRYHAPLLQHGLKLTLDYVRVEECIQELFLYLHERHDHLGDVKHVAAYLMKSFRRRVLAEVRVAAKRRLVSLDSLSPERMVFATEELEYTGEEEDATARAAMVQALNQLPPRQQEAIYLRYYHGFSTREIAEIMGVVDQTILNTIYQALQRMRKNVRLRRGVGMLVAVILPKIWIIV